jgi:SsrA-binding protein
MKIVAINKKLGSAYQLSDKLEAGIVLSGSEIKSIRAKRISINDAYAKILLGKHQKPELYLVNAHIPRYKGSIEKSWDPERSRKLLVKSQELKSLIGKLQSGKNLIPTKVYLKNNLCKVELALATARKLYDKREIIKKRETERRLRQLTRQKQKTQ